MSIGIGKTFTYIALFFGGLAALSCLSISALKWGMFCSNAGIISAVFVIFHRTQFMTPTKWNHPAIIALVLSSIPIIYLIIIIFIFKE